MGNYQGPEKGYVEMLNAATEAYLNKPDEVGARKYNPLRPSSAGKCTRELAYELAEFHGIASYGKEQISPELHRIFDLGHHFERHMIQQFERNMPGFGLRYKQQVVTFFPVTGKTNPKLTYLIEGSIDTCFWSPETHGVVDFKSKKDRFSTFYRTNWEETDEKLEKLSSVKRVSDSFFFVEDLEKFLGELKDPFFEMNFMQLNGYACTEFLRTRGVDHASVIQCNKNDSRMREVRFKPSMALYEKVRAKFQGATDAVDAGDPSLAPRDHVLGSLKCKFCKFAKECWDGKDASRAFYNTLPPKQWPKDTNRMGTDGKMLEALFQAYSLHVASDSAKDVVEAQILKQMVDSNVGKLRLENGEVYEAKRLKDGLALRRSKA